MNRYFIYWNFLYSSTARELRTLTGWVRTPHVVPCMQMGFHGSANKRGKDITKGLTTTWKRK